MLIHVRNLVSDAIRNDESIESLIARKPLAHLKEQWGSYPQSWEDRFLSIVHKSIQ